MVVDDAGTGVGVEVVKVKRRKAKGRRRIVRRESMVRDMECARCFRNSGQLCKVTKRSLEDTTE